MNESPGQNIQINTADNPPDPPAGNEPDTKPVDIDAPYEHAPPKDGDPWTTLLTPELEADTLRCTAWKDEVQNLLIFAGLFSAVVTTFVVESYKLLLPDPNDTTNGLLFHIASGLNNTSPFPPSVSPESILTPFSQTPSAVRINVFWFISLILSLTTVLVGTIALQWLREHQSYSGYSSKEKLAMLHMRSEAIEAWYLPQVFATLPVLLQAALVLFLAGLIDFSLPLGTKVTIPVSIIVGVTLLFLAVTTLLPSYQVLFFFCGLYPRKSLPTPCPFKSPQSHAFRTICGIVFHAIFHIVPSPSLDYDDSSPDMADWKLIIKNQSSLIPDHLASSVWKMWNQHTWPALDREWLSLRDACHQRIFDNDPDLYQHRAQWSFPLSDVTRYLIEVADQTSGFKHTDSYLAALVHCFSELAESIWIDDVPKPYHFQRKDRRSNYFEYLFSGPFRFCSLSNFILHGGNYKFDQLKEDNLYDYLKHAEVKPRLFSTDQTMIFLYILFRNHSSPALLQYHRELWVRLLPLVGNIAPLTLAMTDGSQSIPIPAITTMSMVYSVITDENFAPGQKYLDMTNILTTIFQLAASHSVSQQRIESLLAHPDMTSVLGFSVFKINGCLVWAQKDPLTKEDILRDGGDQLTQLAEFISAHLNARSNKSSSFENAPVDVLFYLSSMLSWSLLRWPTFLKSLRDQDSHFGQALRSLLNALHKTWMSGRKNDPLEKRFKPDYNYGGVEEFSNEWWNEIFEHLTDPHTIPQGPVSAAEGPPDARPDPLTQSASPPENETEDAINPLVATSPGNLYRSRELNMLDSDAPPPSAHPDPQLEISGHEPAPILVNHEVARIPDPQPDSPTILHQPPTLAAEGAGTINVLPLAPIISSFDKPDETRPSDDVHTAAGAVPPSVPKPPASFSIADPEGLQQAASSRSGEQDLQPDGLHLTIDVRPPTSPEHSPGAGGDRSLGEAEPEDAVVRMESPI